MNMGEYTIKLSKWTVVKVAVVATLMLGSMFLGAFLTVPEAYRQGYNEGVVSTLEEVRTKLAEADIDFEWTDLGDGKYVLNIKAAFANGQSTDISFTTEVDFIIEHYRDGQLLSSSRGAGTLTTWGMNWIEQQLSGTMNTTQSALYLGDSNDASAPSTAWTELPNEITTNGLERQLGVYTSTGDGTWNVTKTKSVTGTQSTQLWGLYASTIVGSGQTTLIAADSDPSQKNCINGDTLAETWQVTVT